MDTVKEYVGCINPHWVAIVSAGMYTYLRHICIVGLCFEEENNPPFDPSYSSILFVFSALCLVAEYRLWPRSLKEPPIQLLYIYEANVGGCLGNKSCNSSYLATIDACNILLNSRVDIEETFKESLESHERLEKRISFRNPEVTDCFTYRLATKSDP
uniref:Uncharacterized protein n=1 Tax=Vespula pensylvanica TaxID=30213 RepID=A0A834K3T4_VESPE|nr:hypothetical protein H0235_015631 [Vespula pensylvanica]